MDFSQEASNLIWTSEGFGNSVAIDLGNMIVIVDTMFNWKLAKKWRLQVENHFSQNVKMIFLTHHHD